MSVDCLFYAIFQKPVSRNKTRFWTPSPEYYSTGIQQRSPSLPGCTQKRPALRSQKKANKMLLVKSLVYYLVIKMCQASFLKNIKCTSFLKRLTKRESCVHYHKTCDRIDDRDNKPPVKSCISEAVYICYLVVTY